jgi:hypothetical protein
VSEKLTGSCLCGSVQYELVGEAQKFYHCHCRRCRKASGTGHASNIVVTPESFRWTRGEELLTFFKLPEAERFATNFCGRCGSPMPRVTADHSRAVIPAGSLDNLPEIRPQARIFWDSRVQWSCSGDGIPTYPGYPE